MAFSIAHPIHNICHPKRMTKGSILRALGHMALMPPMHRMGHRSPLAACTLATCRVVRI